MKNRAVKLLSLLMCMVMIFTSLPVGALADGEDTQPTEEALETAPPDEEGVPKESAENSVEPVSVEFICAPESLTLSVYAKEDEAHKNPILPEEDGSYLLLPGFYTYTAECEGYESAEDVEFEVTADEKLEMEVTLALTAKNSFAIDAPEMATVATTYAAASSSLSSDEVTSRLDSIKESSYPYGSTYPYEFGGGSQCYAFARYLANEVFGSYPWNCSAYGNGYIDGNGWSLIIGPSADTSIVPGDIIEVRNTGTHTAIVWKISGNEILVGECWGSQNCKVAWGYYNGTSSNSTLAGIINTYGASNVYVWKRPNAPTTRKCTLTFDANGGSCSTGSVQVSAGGTLNSLPTPTRSGYDFVGWYWSKTYGNEFHTYYAIDSDTTLYAHWARQSNPGIKINFNTNGGSLPTARLTRKADGINKERLDGELIVYDWTGAAVVTNEYGCEISVNRNGAVDAKRGFGTNDYVTVSDKGFVLSGHKGDSDDNGNNFIEKIQDDYIAFDYATKTVRAYDDYDAYLAENKYVSKGSYYGLLPESPTRDGYVFDGWYTSASGGTKITATSTVSVSSAQTLYAHWTVPCEHNYTTQTVAGTCTQIPGTIYTCTKCGDSYFAASTFYMSSWSATKPSGVDESLIESRIEYRSREKEYTSSANSSMSG